MEIKFCPKCGGSVTPQFAFCPRCGAKLPQSRERIQPVTPEPAQEDPRVPVSHHSSAESVMVTFRCSDSGMPIATSAVPMGFRCSGKILSSGANDFSQLRDWVKAESEDRRTALFSESHMIWETFLSQILKQTAGIAGINPANLTDFQEPEQLMKGYGERLVQTQLTPVAKATLPGHFAQARQEHLNAMINTFLSRDGTAPNVQLEIINAVCDPLLMKFSGTKDGRPILVLIGCEYKGIEYRNAITPMMLMGGTLGLLGGILSARGTAKAKEGTAPFGHGREYGKQSDAIRWGFNRMYLCVADASDEVLATEQFLKFAASFTQDAALTQQREQMEFQIFQRGLKQANMLAAQARQNQIMAQQRAMETSRIIARNSAEMSAGIMDSWNKKMASDSRISNNYSEAIRGVNTYQTTSGRPVEVDVTADHVYENRYGDVYGVSGSELDTDMLNRLDWTKLDK